MFSLLFLSLIIASIAFGQGKGQEIANLEKIITQCKDMEARQQKLYEQLQSGAVVMIAFDSSRKSERIPYRTSDIREYLLTSAILAELAKPNPNLDAAVDRANSAAEKLIALAKDDSRAKMAALPDEMSRVRAMRLKTEKLVKAGREARSSTAFGGTWTTNWGDMVLTQSGSKVTGTYEHLDGKIDGSVEGDGQLHFKWTQSNGHGIGVIKIDVDGKTFSGTWNYTDDSGQVGSGGTWTGTRR